jgi:predicted dehydrogenase
MGKAHSVAFAAVGAVFNTALRPRLEMIAARSTESAERYRAAYGFARGTGNWQQLVEDPHMALRAARAIGSSWSRTRMWTRS